MVDIKEIGKSIVSKTVVGLVVIFLLALVIGVPLFAIGMAIWNYKDVYTELIRIGVQLKPLSPNIGLFILTILACFGFIFGLISLLSWSFEREMGGEEQIGDGQKTFLEYVQALNKFLEEHPELSDKKVVYSSDSEGNSFHEVYYTPSFGEYNEKEKNFESKEVMEEPVNAVCIN